MTQAVNMTGSSIYTLLAIIAIVVQNCPLTKAKDSGHSYPRRHGGNANINTNINTFHKSRRLYETLARSSKETDDDKSEIGKDVQAAIIATAAADAAEAATRMLVKKLSEHTADAVATAVVRVLSGDDRNNKTDNTTEDKANKTVERASKHLHQALNRLLYHTEKKLVPASRKSLAILAPYAVKKRQDEDDSYDEEEEEELDASGIAHDSDEEDIEPEIEPDAKHSKAHVKNRLHRRFLDRPDVWKNHYRRSADVTPGSMRDNKAKSQI